MSNFIDPLKDNLYLSARSVLNILGYEDDIEVIFSYEDILSPEVDYLAISLLSITRHGMADKSDVVLRATNSDEIDYVSHYTLLAQYSFIGKNSAVFATDFNQAISHNTVCLMEYRSNNLGILNTTKLRSNPQKWETQWVDGWNFDINLTYALHTTHKFEWIDKVIIKGEGMETTVEYSE